MIDKIAHMIEELENAGLTVSRTWYQPWNQWLERQYGPRLYCSNIPFPRSKVLLSVVSSHLGRHLYRRREWFGNLRLAMLKAIRQRSPVLIFPQTAVGNIILHAARRLSVPHIVVEVASDDQSPEDWVRGTLKNYSHSTATASPQFIRISPRLDQQATCDAAGSPITPTLPNADIAAIGIADRIIILHLRPRSRTFHLAKSRIADPVFPTGSVLVNISPNRADRLPALQLQNEGAVAWWTNFDTIQSVATDVWKSRCHTYSSVSGQLPVISDRLLPNLTKTESSFLVHCTRGRMEQWPDQSEERYWDDLLMDTTNSDQSPGSTLLRILHTKTISVSHHLTRGPRGVVSFSAVPLMELLQRRTYRSHLGRWDWEPYGIAISRKWLESHGARKVQYGNDHDIAAQPLSEQIYWQPRGPVGSGQTLGRWEAEREWRIDRPISLTEIDPHQAFLFAPPSWAKLLSYYSNWPVVSLDHLG